MSRYTFPAFVKAATPRYVVVWDLHWQVLECHRLESGEDLSGAMISAIHQLAIDGRRAESQTMASCLFGVRLSGGC